MAISTRDHANSNHNLPANEMWQLVIAPFLLSTTGQQLGPGAVPMADGERHLFIDDAILVPNSVDNAVLRMHPPRKTGEVVIVADRPWEGVIFYYDSIVQVSDREFRIYYVRVLPTHASPLTG